MRTGERARAAVEVVIRQTTAGKREPLVESAQLVPHRAVQEESVALAHRSEHTATGRARQGADPEQPVTVVLPARRRREARPRRSGRSRPRPRACASLRRDAKRAWLPPASRRGGLRGARSRGVRATRAGRRRSSVRRDRLRPGRARGWPPAPARATRRRSGAYGSARERPTVRPDRRASASRCRRRRPRSRRCACLAGTEARATRACAGAPGPCRRRRPRH